jgi:TRAP-type C4-dicarboxylate transport system permease large subunit
MAVAGLLGRSLFPTMRKRGYDTQFSAGTILAGASLDPIIPPSVLAIIVATIADVSAGRMLIAGILPGLLLTGMFLIWRQRRHGFRADDSLGLYLLHGDGPHHAGRRHAD